MFLQGIVTLAIPTARKAVTVKIEENVDLQAAVKVALKKWRSSVTCDGLQFLRLKFWWPFISHHHLLVAFFLINLLHICTFPPLPSHAQLRSPPLHIYMCRSAALEKLEVAERRCSTLCLTLTTAYKKIDWASTSAELLSFGHSLPVQPMKHEAVSSLAVWALCTLQVSVRIIIIITQTIASVQWGASVVVFVLTSFVVTCQCILSAQF